MTNKLAELVYFQQSVRDLLYVINGHSEQVNTEVFKIIQNLISVTHWLYWDHINCINA